MAIQQRTSLYEVLVRLNAAGVVGAHVVDMIELVDDTGTVLSARESQARPIAAAEVGTVLGGANALLLEQVAALTAERDAALAGKAAAETALASAEAAASTAAARVAALEAEVAALTAPAPAATTITPLQARRALRAAGLYDTVKAAIDQAPPEVQDAWEFAFAWERTDPLIASIGAALGLGEAEIDNLFAVARTM